MGSIGPAARAAPVLNPSSMDFRQGAPDRERILTISVPVSYGEVLDKISILEIKLAHVSRADQRKNIECELRSLAEARAGAFSDGPDIREIYDRLSDVNKRLWSVEDDLRECERKRVFDGVFIDLARSVYKLNDHRAALKRKLNKLLGSPLVEEKLYRDY